MTSEIKLNVFFNGVFTERAQIIYCQLIFLMVGFRVKSEIKLNDLPHTPWFDLPSSRLVNGWT